MGGALLLVAGAALGLSLLGDMRRRAKELSAMDAALGLLVAEIERLRPLPESFALLAGRGPLETRGFFAVLSRNCGGMTAAEAWENSLEKLGEAERELLLPLAAVLGARDAASQCAEIAAVRPRLRDMAEQLRRDIAAKGKSYPLIGVCAAGIALCLII